VLGPPHGVGLRRGQVPLPLRHGDLGAVQVHFGHQALLEKGGNVGEVCVAALEGFRRNVYEMPGRQQFVEGGRRLQQDVALRAPLGFPGQGQALGGLFPGGRQAPAGVQGHGGHN
jgi:hypothetical protein